MEIYRTLEGFQPLSSSVLTIGSYDGLHRGHFEIINRVQTIARSMGAISIVITFDPHPRHVINKDHDIIEIFCHYFLKLNIYKKIMFI